MSILIEAMEKGLLPDPAIRFGIRRLCKERLKSLKQPTLELNQKQASNYVEGLKNSPLAMFTLEANEQHYEIPATFFNLVLGRNRKYSSAYWPEGCTSLDEAEDIALAMTIERAEITDGMQILELGCGWGSLTLAMAKKFPNSKIIALSNSNSQRERIKLEVLKNNLNNVKVITRNIVDVYDLGD